MSKGYSALAKQQTAPKAPSAPKPIAVGDEVRVADWFSFELPSYAIQPKKVRIVGESASGKAWRVDVYADSADGEREFYFSKYIPKAAARSEAQYQQEMQSRAQTQQQRFEAGQKRYNAMIEFAKSKKIKGVRVGLTKQTILRKIKEAGYDYEY